MILHLLLTLTFAQSSEEDKQVGYNGAVTWFMIFSLIISIIGVVYLIYSIYFARLNLFGDRGFRNEDEPYT